MIGLLDLDLQTSSSVNLHPPNLEIMKLASYYSLEKNTFCKLIDLNESQYEGYDKIYCFSEQEIMPSLPDCLKGAQNLILGGTGFTNGIYIPFEEPLIDFSLPRTTIYKEYLKAQYKNGIKAKIITHILDDSYYRITAGKTILPLPAIKKHQRFYLYDTDIFVDNWEQIMQRIVDRAPASIQCIHPIICKNLSQYINLRKFLCFSRKNIIYLDLNIPLDETYYLFKKYKNFFLEDINPTTPVGIPIGGNYQSKKLYVNDFIYKINLLYSFWRQDIPIKLYVRESQLGYNNPIYHIEKKMETLSSFKRAALLDTSFVSTIPKKKKDNVLLSEYEWLLSQDKSVRFLLEPVLNTIYKRGKRI